MKPTFTIVTCTRNSMGTLAETVRSVQAQTFADYEHVFVDGNSTDGTLEYIRSLSGNVRLIEGAGGGISRAMNAGIEAARGRYVAHLHSDDYYAAPHVLEHVAAAFSASGARWLFGRCCYLTAAGLNPGQHPFPYSHARLLKRNFICHPATFAEKALFDECGTFDPAIRYAMDYDLWLRFSRVAEPVQMDEDLAVFRVHDGSLSSANRLAAFEEDHQVRMKYLAGHPMLWLESRLRHVVRRYRLLAQLEAEGA